MRFLQSTLSSLIAAVAMSSSVTTLSIPTFELLFSGTIHIGEIGTLEGPLGTRLHAAITSGKFTDPSGSLVGSLLPTADNGVLSTSGIFFPDVVLPIRWAVDGKMGYLQAVGVGHLSVGNMVYVHAETDSPAWSELNSRFLVANLTFSDNAPNDPVFALFGVL